MPRRTDEVMLPVRSCAVALVIAIALGTVPIARAADPAKVLRVAMSIAETSFDPSFASDAASDAIIANVFETMLDYDYLARPVVLVPRGLVALPVVEEAAGPMFAACGTGCISRRTRPSRVSAAKSTAADYAYSFRRVLDPQSSRRGSG